MCEIPRPLGWQSVKSNEEAKCARGVKANMCAGNGRGRPRGRGGRPAFARLFDGIYGFGVVTAAQDTTPPVIYRDQLQLQDSCSGS